MRFCEVVVFLGSSVSYIKSTERLNSFEFRIMLELCFDENRLLDVYVICESFLTLS